jgi:hypothetical protein
MTPPYVAFGPVFAGMVLVLNSVFEYRWNTRCDTDGQRMERFLPMIEGKRLMYRRPKN